MQRIRREISLRNPPSKAKTAWFACRQSAHKRRIYFLLTFEEWWKIWFESGHWHERGCHKGQYCMARYSDKGPYKVGNVKIVTIEENIAERQMTPEYRAKISDKLTGIKRSRAFRSKISKSLIGNTRSEGKANAAGARSAASRVRMSKAAKKRGSNQLGLTRSKKTKALIRENRTLQTINQRLDRGITPELIQQIQTDYSAKLGSQRSLAEKYGLTRGTIRNIVGEAYV